MNTQPDLFPERGIEHIEVQGEHLAAAEQRIKDIGAVLLGFSVKGATYTLRVIMPPGDTLETLKTHPN